MVLIDGLSQLWNVEKKIRALSILGTSVRFCMACTFVVTLILSSIYLPCECDCSCEISVL